MIKIDLIGRVERVHLAPRNALLPLFEAVSNSIDAIKSRSDERKGCIEIELARESFQKQFEPHTESFEPISEIRITDNGVGFTNHNMNAFQELDTRNKINTGGKGIGRLRWLKVFEKVKVNSIYREGSEYRERSFDFSLPDGVENSFDHKVETEESDGIRTTISLQKAKEPYCDALRYRAETIVTALERQFLYYLLDAAPPEVTIVDGGKGFALSAKNVLERATSEFKINDHAFTIEHLKVHSPQRLQHSAIFCANRRPVKEEKLKNLPSQKFEDDKEGFFYQAYVSSSYLDARVDEQRTSLVLEDEPDQFEVSADQLREQIEVAADHFLSKELNTLREERDLRVRRVINERVPELKYVQDYNRDEVAKRVSLDDTDAAVEEILSSIHLRNQRTGRELMSGLVRDLKGAVTLDLSGFEKEFGERISSITRPSEASLASYVLYRRSIIELYEEILKKSEDRFQREAAVHKLMFPMGADLDSSKWLLHHNLWLLDERLTFAQYIASDMPLADHQVLFDVENRKRPDIVCYFNLGFSEDNPAEGDLRNVVIVELKRPGPLADRPETPWQQTMGYMDKILEGTYENTRGQKVKASKDTRFYCFIVCDKDDPKIQEMIKRDQFKPIYDGLDGYILYHEPYKAYVELVPFEKILRDTKRKHRAFFERLGLT